MTDGGARVWRETRRLSSMKRLFSFFELLCDDLHVDLKSVSVTFASWHFRALLADRPQGSDPLIPASSSADPLLADELCAAGAPSLDDALKAAGDLAERSARLHADLQAERAPGDLLPVDVDLESHTMMSVSCGDVSFPLSRSRYETLLAAHTGGSDSFNDNLFCMLCRYASLFSPGMQGAIPPPVFDTLRRHFPIAHELFASPLNSAQPTFCSLFPDTDAVFGSIGSFFEADLSSGMHQANPPFVESLMSAMVDRMQDALSRAEKTRPLGFVVFLPAFDGNGKECALSRICKSAFFRRRVWVERGMHEYFVGDQHATRSQTRRFVRAGFHTCVVVLQTSEAAAAWPVKDSFDADVMDAFRPTSDANALSRKRRISDELEENE